VRFVVALATALIVLGCGSLDQEGKTVVRISNWGGAGDDSEYEKIILDEYAKFEKENPGVDVRVEGIPGSSDYVNKMLLNFVANTQPDVMVLDASSAAVFVNNGLLSDLNPFIQKDPDLAIEDYYPNVVEVATRGKAIYAIPGDFTPMVMYYNKDLFDAAGVPYPDASWNFEQFLETAKKLTVHSRQQYGFVFPNWMPSWIMWFWNNGGDVLSPDGKRASGFLDSEQNIRTVEWLREMILVHKVAPTLSEIASTGVDLFAEGQAAMAVGGHWSLITYKNAPKDNRGKPKIDWKRLGVVALPHNTPQSQTVMYEAGFGIPKGAKNPELGWKLIKMWTGYRLQSRYNASGIAVCARKDVSKERAQDPIEAQFIPIIQTARPPWGASVEGYDAVERIGKVMMDSVLIGGADVRTALKRAAEAIDREFGKR